jgi:hypothetical protein
LYSQQEAEKWKNIEEYHIYLHNTCTAHFKQKYFRHKFGVKEIIHIIFQPSDMSNHCGQDSRLQELCTKDMMEYLQIWTWIYSTVYGEEVGQR